MSLKLHVIFSEELKRVFTYASACLRWILLSTLCIRLLSDIRDTREKCNKCMTENVFVNFNSRSSLKVSEGSIILVSLREKKQYHSLLCSFVKAFFVPSTHLSPTAIPLSKTVHQFCKV